MNFLLVWLFLFSVSASNQFGTDETDRYEASHGILDSKDFAVWNHYFAENPDPLAVYDAINYTIKTDKLSLLEDIINEYEASEGRPKYAEHAAHEALFYKRHDALIVALRLMNSRHDLANLFEKAFASGNCDAVRILTRRVQVNHDPFKPNCSFPQMPIEAARADGFSVFFELFETDFFRNGLAPSAVPFNYEDLTEDDYFRLVENVPEWHWERFTYVAFSALRKAFDMNNLRAMKYILGRPGAQRIINRADSVNLMLILDAIGRNQLDMIRAWLDAGFDVNSDRLGKTECVLTLAIKFGTPDMVDLIMARGTDLCKLDKAGSNSYIVCAIERGDMDIYLKLVDNGVPMVLTDESIKSLMFDGDPGRLAVLKTATHFRFIRDKEVDRSKMISL